jgi:hypothetical protein
MTTACFPLQLCSSWPVPSETLTRCSAQGKVATAPLCWPRCAALSHYLSGVLVVLGLGIALVIVGGAAIYCSGRWLDSPLHMTDSRARRNVVFALRLAGIPVLFAGLVLLYLAWLLTTDNFGR